MSARIRIRPSRFLSVAFLAAVVFAATAIDAGAACFTNGVQSRVKQLTLPAFATAGLAAQSRAGVAAVQAPAQPSSPHSIVGMWLAEFQANDGTGGTFLWDQGFELFHADGTEVAVDNAVPPILGNVCIGVWKSTDPRTITLRHMTWNWNPDGSKAGTFLLLVTATVSPDGQSYQGTFVSHSYDTEGKVIPAFDAEGKVSGTRINVD